MNWWVFLDFLVLGVLLTIIVCFCVWQYEKWGKKREKKEKERETQKKKNPPLFRCSTCGGLNWERKGSAFGGVICFVCGMKCSEKLDTVYFRSQGGTGGSEIEGLLIKRSPSRKKCQGIFTSKSGCFEKSPYQRPNHYYGTRFKPQL